MGVEILNVCDRLLAAAVNGVYQGIIITVLAALSLRALSRTNAATRHAVWLCTLVLLVSLVMAHCFVGSRVRAVHPNEVAGMAATPKQSIGRDSLSLSAMTPPSEDANPLVGNPASQSAEQREAKPGNSPVAVEQLVASDGKDSGFEKLMQRLANPIPLTFAIESRAARVSGTIVLSVCMALATLRILVVIVRLHQIRKLKRHSLPPSATINALFQDMVRRLELRRKVQLKTSPTSQSFVLGFFHPTILLPSETLMEPGEAEHILRHELAHVQRRDDWANLIQHFILAAFPFHPAVWWISRRLSLEREIACDDHVLQSIAQPRAYALLLANLAARLQRGPPLLAPGASNNKTQLQQRIDMILNTQRNKSPRLAATSFALVTSVAAFFAITVICSAPRFVLAQNEPAPATAGSPIEGVPVGAAGGGTPAVELAIPLPTPEAPESRFSPIPGAPPKPAAIASGPKFKPGLSEAITAQPSEPKPPRTPRPPRSRPDSSLEERLERLERMVETLMARQGTSRDLRALKQSAEIDRKGIAKIDAFPKRHADVAGKQVIEPDEIEKIKEQAKHEAARAAAQAKRAAVQAEKAAKFEQTQQTTPEFKDGQKTQLEALRKQLEMLERERKKLDRQIERLQRDQEKLNEQLEKDQSSDAQSNLFKTAPSFENKAARR